MDGVDGVDGVDSFFDRREYFSNLSGHFCPFLIDCRTFLSDNTPMNRDEFIKRIKKLGKANGIDVRFDQSHGKGSHGTLFYGDKRTTVKKGEIPKGLLTAMLKQLGIDKGSF